MQAEERERAVGSEGTKAPTVIGLVNFVSMNNRLADSAREPPKDSSGGFIGRLIVRIVERFFGS